MKNQPNARIFVTFARKINKIPEFYMIFAQKMPEFYMLIARKIFSRFFFLGGGREDTCPRGSSTPMTLISSNGVELPRSEHWSVGRSSKHMDSYVRSFILFHSVKQVTPSVRNKRLGALRTFLGTPSGPRSWAL